MSDIVSPRRQVALSRRQAIAAAATVGAVGVGLAAGSGFGIAGAKEDPKKASDGYDDAIIVRVRDVDAGTLDVFTGSDRIEVRDKDLAKRLAKAAKKR